MAEQNRDNQPAATFLDMVDSGGDTQTQDNEHTGRKPPTEPLLAPGAKLGRYVIIETLGKGGMGVVYKAVDPDLGRWVAVKLVRVRQSARARPESLDDARARLLREAQALAKVKHPNVVTVHDVGRFGDDIFIAMEFVEGVTLRRWLDNERRSVADIVRVMSAAGAGLSAAHAAGLVHRDFKPANVMIGLDERVWVLDFGLVRSADFDHITVDLADAASTDVSADVTDSADALEEAAGITFKDALDHSEALTRQGAVVGTPSYMAPEQYAGSAIDQRTDLFSFCVVLYEALYGAKPFRKKGIARLRKAIRTGDFADPPTDRPVPTWLEAVWRRGLAPSPDDRYPSMQALLVELGRDRQRQRRRWLTLAAVLALMALAAVAGAFIWRAEPAPAVCQGARAQLADVWDDNRRTATERAFLATGKVYALETYQHLRARLDQYAQDWVDMHARVCRATRVTGEQSELLLDTRMRCLDRQRVKLAALTELFARQPDATVLDNSIRAVSALPAVSACADLDPLSAQAALPEDEALRTAIADLRQRLDRLQSAYATGEYKANLKDARAIAAEARALDYAPVAAEAGLAVGTLQSLSGDRGDAEETLRAAARDTARARDDRLFARVLVRLLNLVGARKAHGEEAELTRWAAENAVVRAGSPPSLRAQLLANLGDIAWHQGQFDEATRLHESALIVHRDQLGDGDSLAAAASYWSLARIYWTQGKNDQARAYIQRALAVNQRVLGHEHPDVGKLWGNIGTTLVGDGQYSEARPYLERALAITEKALGEDHPDVAGLLNNLGDVLSREDNFQVATGYFQRARAVFSRVYGTEHHYVGICWQNLGEMDRLQERYEDSLTDYDTARDIFQRALGAEHPFLAFPLTSKGLSLIGLGRIAEAVSLLERALALRTRSSVSDTDLATTQFALARALWPKPRPPGGARGRAEDLARAALSAYISAGEAFAEKAEEIRAWLSARSLGV